MSKPGVSSTELPPGGEEGQIDIPADPAADEPRELELYVGREYNGWTLMELEDPIPEQEGSFVAVFEGRKTISGVVYAGPSYPLGEALVFRPSDGGKHEMPLSDAEQVDHSGYLIMTVDSAPQFAYDAFGISESDVCRFDCRLEITQVTNNHLPISIHNLMRIDRVVYLGDQEARVDDEASMFDE